MQRRWLMRALPAVVAVGLGVLGHAATPGEQLIGDWTGSWAGSGNGRFGLSFARSGERVVGSISCDTAEGNYTVPLQGLSFSGSKMSARYEYPFDPRKSIVIDGDFRSAQAEGTWALLEAGDEVVMYEGTWSVRRQ